MSSETNTQFYQIALDENNIVTGYAQSNAPQADLVYVTPEIFAAVAGARRLGRVKFVDGALVDYEPPPAPAPPGITQKADLWRRATDAEAEAIMAGLNAQPLRKRQIFADATYLKHDDPDFLDLRAGFVIAFGEARTAELLAPSA